MPLPTYDELCDAGLICPDTPQPIVYEYMTTLHTDPPPTIPVTIIVQGGVVQDIQTPHPKKITAWLIDYDGDAAGLPTEYPVSQEPC